MLRKITLALCAIALLSVHAAEARPNNQSKNWFGHVEVGFTLGQGDYGDVVDDDFSYSGGALYHPADWPFGIDFTFSYNDQDFTNQVIRGINDQIPPGMGEITGGDVRIMSFSPSLVWSTRGTGVGFSFSVGAGIYDIRARLTNEGLVYYPPVCDPYFWWCVPGGVGPGTIVQAEQSSTEFGWNVGLGLTFPHHSGAEIFFEAKLHTIETDPVSTEYIPLSIGIRW